MCSTTNTICQCRLFRISLIQSILSLRMTSAHELRLNNFNKLEKILSRRLCNRCRTHDWIILSFLGRLCDETTYSIQVDGILKTKWKSHVSLRVLENVGNSISAIKMSQFLMSAHNRMQKVNRNWFTYQQRCTNALFSACSFPLLNDSSYNWHQPQQ